MYFWLWADGRSKTTVYDEPAEYWETSGSQLNGIGAYGPWAFWGGWNGGSAFKKENYKFLVTEDGVCKAMSWVTGSRAEWKQDIREYEDGALEKVLGSTVYRYQLKEHPKNEEENISDLLLATDMHWRRIC